MDALARLFTYAVNPHGRRHEPRGYSDYPPFKPWLRDDYCFRCVYCLLRERCCPLGQADFGVDHLRPRTARPDLVIDYRNLVYACNACNAVKGPVERIPDPCHVGYGAHLTTGADGVVRSHSPEGEFLIAALRLNRPRLLQWRRFCARMVERIQQRDDDEARRAWRHFLGFPDDLPDLGALRPPRGNGRPDGIQQSFLRRRERGELPDDY